ncbi:MAG: helix-turn-helix domain-containing GNAT family N-acetyltransferase [Pseudomonadota bacterium]
MAVQNKSERNSRVAVVRQFNRFYTREIGVLERQLLESPFSLTEARVLFELANCEGTTAKAIGDDLGLDPGYMSRIVQALAKQGLLTRKPSPDDGRQFVLSLTAKGRAAFARLDKRSHEMTSRMLDRLQAGEQRRLVGAITTVQQLLNNENPRREITLRNHRPGDMGWVVQQHGALYAREFGWDISFEGLVAEIVAQFLKDFDPQCERCWIADMDGKQAGSVFLVKHTNEVAKLRLLIVDPAARGTGLGKRLVDECTSFARARGYRRITLWTQSMLLAARGIYESAGFMCIESKPHRSFGRDLVGETWELTL